MATPAAVVEQPEDSVRVVRVKILCSHCERVFVRHSRKGYTARCPHCGTINAGPALLAEQTKPKVEGPIQRRASRRPRTAPQPAEREAPGKLQPGAPAPVRRKRAAPQAGGAKTPTAASAAGDAPSQGTPPPAPVRRGLLDRLIYGDGDE